MSKSKKPTKAKKPAKPRKRIPPSSGIIDTTIEDAYRRGKAHLEHLRDSLIGRGFDARADILIEGKGADTVIRGEVRVASIPRGTDAIKLITIMERYTQSVDEFWGSIVIIRPTRESEYITGKIWSGNRFIGWIQTHWSRLYPHIYKKRPRSDMYGINKVYETAGEFEHGARAMRRRKPEMIAWRIAWDMTHGKPDRVRKNY